MWLDACSNRLTIATGISSVATLATFISLPVSIPLGAVSLAGASVRACLYGGGLARVPRLAALPRSHLQKKFHSITYNVLSCVHMRAGPDRLGKIPPLLTRDLS